MALMSAREALAKRQKEVYICRLCLIFPSGRVKKLRGVRKGQARAGPFRQGGLLEAGSGRLRRGFVMKKDIHPKVFMATITCACGHEEQVLSTKGEQVHVEVCSACHPFFTGKQRFLDTAGRIDRFRKKYAKFEQK